MYALRLLSESRLTWVSLQTGFKYTAERQKGRNYILIIWDVAMSDDWLGKNIIPTITPENDTDAFSRRGNITETKKVGCGHFVSLGQE